MDMHLITINIGGKEYKVKEKDGAFESDNELVDGSINYRDCLITINTQCSEDYQGEIFIHEMIHGIIKEYNVPICEEDNEKITRAFAKGLYQVLKDNFFQK